MFSRNVLVIGMSHVHCISKSLIDYPGLSVSVVDLNESENIKENQAGFPLIDNIEYPLDSIYLSIDGNCHNSIGLVENPVPFAIGEEISGELPSGKPDRIFIPRDMMAALFKERLSGTFNYMRHFSNMFWGLPLYCFCSPPPVGDSEHLRSFPGRFHKKIKQGIAPNELRLELYKLQTDMYREMCRSLEIEFVFPPETAIDNDGFLGTDYWGNDPTHGNRAYGALMLQQIIQCRGL